MHCGPLSPDSALLRLRISRLDNAQHFYLSDKYEVTHLAMVSNLLIVQLSSLEILVIGLLLLDVESVTDQELSEYTL